MLILTRKEGERVMIGDAISVTLVEIRGTQIKLGFDAPRELAIHRREIWELIQAEVARANRAVAENAVDGVATEPPDAEVLTEEASADWLNQLSVPPLVTTRPVTDGISEERAA